MAMAIRSFLCTMMAASALRAKTPQDGLNLDDFAPLCDEEIVRDTCRLLNEGDKHQAVEQFTTWQEIAEHLSAEIGVLDKFKEKMGYTAKDGKVWIECKPLCETVVDLVKQVGAVVPPKSDIACYSHGDKTFCDLDVRPSVLKTLGPASDRDLPDFKDDLFLRSPEELWEQDQKTIALAREGQVEGATEPGMPMESGQVEGATEPGMPMESDTPLAAGVTYDFWEALERLANLFRIYPDSGTQSVDSKALEDGSSNSFLQGSFRSRSQNRTKGLTPDQEQLFLQKLKMAKAYMSLVIRAFSAKETQEHMTRWFGRDAFFSPMVRKEVLRVMNSVDHMISNVYLVYPGSLCQRISNYTMAYVWSKGGACEENQIDGYMCRTRKSTNQFVFYLCPHLLTQPANMVETLVHEGSHHSTAFTEDIKFQGKTAYGRQACYQLAQKEPLKALRNADSFCYYIQDAAVDLTDSPRDRVSKSLTCPKTAKSEIPDLDGDCTCAAGLKCHFGGKLGCPYSDTPRRGIHNMFYFNSDCPGCFCEGNVSTTDMSSWDGNSFDSDEKLAPTDLFASQGAVTTTEMWSWDGNSFSFDWDSSTKSEPEGEPKSEPESEAESEAKSEPESEPESEPKSEPESEAEGEAKSEPESEPESVPESEPEGNLKCPEHSALPIADSKGDCYCSGGRHCFMWNEKGCVYSETTSKQRLSPMYFSASCSECRCMLDG